MRYDRQRVLDRLCPQRTVKIGPLIQVNASDGRLFIVGPVDVLTLAALTELDSS